MWCTGKFGPQIVLCNLRAKPEEGEDYFFLWEKKHGIFLPLFQSILLGGTEGMGELKEAEGGPCLLEQGKRESPLHPSLCFQLLPLLHLHSCCLSDMGVCPPFPLCSLSPLQVFVSLALRITPSPSFPQLTQTLPRRQKLGDHLCPPQAFLCWLAPCEASVSIRHIDPPLKSATLQRPWFVMI